MMLRAGREGAAGGAEGPDGPPGGDAATGAGGQVRKVNNAATIEDWRGCRVRWRLPSSPESWARQHRSGVTSGMSVLEWPVARRLG